MLSPDARTVAMDVLRPPAGYRIDQAVLTTYSLDLDVLLALPLAVLAYSDRGVDELMEDPLLLLEALREAGERLHVFVDEAGIAVPHTNRALYAMLEQCVHPVRAPNGGAFHPKVWMIRFAPEDGPPLMRVAVASRNLTFDRSWDIALVSEAMPEGRRRIPESAALAELLRALPGLAVRGLDTGLTEVLEELASQLARCPFPAPEGFDDPIAFEALGLVAGPEKPWAFRDTNGDLMAVAPFASRSVLDGLASLAEGKRTLISRREALDDLPEQALAAWDPVLVMADAAIDEPGDETAGRTSDLHAKMIALEYGGKATWHVGSANLTHAAFTRRNVEMMAAITGRRNPPGRKPGFGIQQFLDSGFGNLCEPYRRVDRPAEAVTLAEARERLEEARRILVRSDLKVICRPDGESWRWRLEGNLELPGGISVAAWPVSVGEDQGRKLPLPLEWTLPISRLTAFVAFRLHAHKDLDDMRLALKLPAEGMPEGRVAQVLRTLIDSPERLLQFLRALLGGLEGMADWALESGDGAWQGQWSGGMNGETLLEDLLRAASRDPKRLEPVRRLIEDLRATPEGRKIVPDELYAIWAVVDGVVGDDSYPD